MKSLGGVRGTLLAYLCYTLAVSLWCTKRYQLQAFGIASFMFSTKWEKSSLLGLRFLRGARLDKFRYEKVIQAYLLKSKGLVKNPLHLKSPEKSFVSNIIVLRDPKKDKFKGILLIKYSLYFHFFLNNFDYKNISKNYHIILEPSWAGFLDLSILSFNLIAEPVYVMCYEEKDKLLIEHLKSNLLPIDIGPSWFVDHQYFSPSDVKDFDLAMVASWSLFKKHEEVLNALSRIKLSVPNVRAIFIGYKGDIGRSTIECLIEKYDLADNISIEESISPDKVADLVSRSKVSILWSSFEGNNRSLIESMFCGTPVIMKKGHNFGNNYKYINQKTGMFSDSATLVGDILFMMNNYTRFQPRSYVMSNMTYEKATEKIFLAMPKSESDYTGIDGVAKKINYLNGMSYIDKSRGDFLSSYLYLKSCVIIP